MRRCRPSRPRRIGGGVFHEAALDGAQGHWWPVDGLGSEGTPGLLATQRRHVERSGLLLGLGTQERVAQRQGEILDLVGLELRQARSAYHQGGLRGRSRGVVRVLLALEAGRDDRLLAAGHVAGLWGRPWRIDPQTGRRKGLPWRDPPTSFALSRVPAAL